MATSFRRRPKPSEVFAYLHCKDQDAFLAIQEDIFLRIADIVTEGGTGFAFPSQTTYFGRDSGVNAERARETEAKVEDWRDTIVCRSASSIRAFAGKWKMSSTTRREVPTTTNTERDHRKTCNRRRRLHHPPSQSPLADAQRAEGQQHRCKHRDRVTFSRDSCRTMDAAAGCSSNQRSERDQRMAEKLPIHSLAANLESERLREIETLAAKGGTPSLMRSKDWLFFKPLWSPCVKKSMHIRSVLAVDLERLWRSVPTHLRLIGARRHGQATAADGRMRLVQKNATLRRPTSPCGLTPPSSTQITSPGTLAPDQLCGAGRGSRAAAGASWPASPGSSCS